LAETRKPTPKTLRGGGCIPRSGSIDEDGFLTLPRPLEGHDLSGQHIYRAEIEEVLLRHPDRVEASVVGRPHPDWRGGRRFHVAKPGAGVPQAALDKLCLDHIARFKRPREYRFVDALPKNQLRQGAETELRRMLQSNRDQ